MIITAAKLGSIRVNLEKLLHLARQDDYVILAGPMRAYGLRRNRRDVGFFLRPWDDPLRNVSVMPKKLARRIQEFSGGHVVQVSKYICDHITAVDECIKVVRE